MSGPLAGIRVIDLSRGVTGPYATKLLADFGADVLKVEPPGGDPARRHGPFPGDVSDPEQSGLFLNLNTNKRSFVLDLTGPDASNTVIRLASEADVIVEDFAPGEAAANGWGWETLRAVNPALVMVSISPFGQSGPYRDYRGSELTLQAMGGPMHATGNREREPLKLAGHFASHFYNLALPLADEMILTHLPIEVEGDAYFPEWDKAEWEVAEERREADLVFASYRRR